VTEIIPENNHAVSMDCHDFDSVRPSVSTDLTFPRASVCGYLNRPNRYRASTNLTK